MRARSYAAGLVGLGIMLTLGLAAATGKEEAGERRAQAPEARPISSADRVYTADQSSNTVSVIDPSANEVLGTIPLGQDRLDNVLGPVDTTEVNVHGLGFSRDGRRLDVISVGSNGAQVLDTATNRVLRTFHVGRSPHEGFISPDGRELWVAVRGEDHVAVIDLRTGRERRIRTADGPSKVVFAPDGRRAYVNHFRAPKVAVIDVASHQIVARIDGVGAPASADEEISPDGEELWLGHPLAGRTTVIDARKLRVKAVLDTGPRTNHVTFVDGGLAYVTIGGANRTLVFRRTDGAPRQVDAIEHAGESPHGLAASPDGTRVYVALQKSDAVDVIDTAANRVIRTLHVGQSPQALVYVAGAVPRGPGTENLSRQGLGRRVETLAVDVRGASGQAKATIRELDSLDEIDVTARDLPPSTTFAVLAARGDAEPTLLREVRSDDAGTVATGLAFTAFFENYDRIILTPKRS